MDNKESRKSWGEETAAAGGWQCHRSRRPWRPSSEGGRGFLQMAAAAPCRQHCLDHRGAGACQSWQPRRRRLLGAAAMSLKTPSDDAASSTDCTFFPLLFSTLLRAALRPKGPPAGEAAVDKNER